MAGWLFTIAGLGYSPCTPGVTSATSAEADWPTAAVLMPGVLVPPDATIRTTLRPLEGDVDVSSCRFLLHDPPHDFGDDGGVQSFFSWLTRDEDQITSTILGASMGATALTFDVAAGTGASLGSFPRVLWVDAEAILCDSISTDTVTVNAAGRGYYGSRAVAHSLDAEANVFPTVWTACPWVVSRKAILWYVDEGTAYPVWRGNATRPRLEREGAKYEVQCEHLWTSYKRLRAGVTTASCTLRGYDRRYVRPTIFWTPFGTTTIGASTDFAQTTETPYVNNTVTDLARMLEADLRALAYDDADLRVTLSGEGQTLVLQVDGDGGQVGAKIAFVDLHARPQSEIQSHDGAVFSIQTSDPRSVIVRTACPAAWIVVPLGGASIPIDRTERLPTDWTPASVVRTPYLATIQYALRGALNDDTWFILTPSSNAPVTDDNPDVGGPSIDGVVTLAPRKEGGTPLVFDRAHGVTVDKPLPLYLVARLVAGHWALGIRALIEDEAISANGADAQDWNFDVMDRVVNLTATRFSARDWTLDGSEGLQDWLKRETLANGAGVRVLNSKLALVAYSALVANATPDTTVTAADYVDKPSSYTFEDGFVNSAQVKTQQFDLRVNDQTSINRYGPGRTVEVDYTAVPEAYGISPVLLAATLLSRLLGTFNRPLRVVRLPLRWSLTTVRGAEPGTLIRFSDWLAPNGTGSRGYSARLGIVLAKELPTKTGVGAATIWVDVLVVPTGVGYSPCCRVADISGSVVTVATAYLAQSASDYAGSNLPDYDGTPNDGGVSRFAVGDRVQLVFRGSTILTTESLVVQSVDAVAKTITMTGSVPTSPTDWAALVAGGATVDLRYDVYTTSGLQAAQKLYAWVGSDSTGTIGGTSDRAQEWRP